MKNSLWVHAALFLVSLIYAANYSISKDVMPRYIGPYGIVVLRIVGAAVVFELLRRRFAGEAIVGRADNVRAILCGISGIGVNQLLFFGGLNLTTPINASLIQTIAPVVVLLASVVLLGDRITLRRAGGILLAGTGAALIILGRGSTPAATGPDVTLGNIMILLNATFFGVYLVLVMPLMRKYHAFTVLARIFLVGAVIAVPFGWQQVQAADYASFPPLIWVAIAYMVIMLTIVAYLLNNWALKYASPALLGAYIYLQPALAVLIAVSLDKDTLTWGKALQAALIFSGVFLVSRKPKEKTVIGEEVPLEPVQD
ncbi:DMT family transporter [Hymenobacter koreensis]|uniref:DMT family transporter n=1 Tax=Hymenobacter koreensis TaxID=1084523 RepID=A0ABP8IUP9_9BACT